MKVSGIYQIKCNSNGKVYIGKAKDIPARWKEHLTQLKEGKHSCRPLQADFNKYGIENFSLSVKEAIDISQLKEREADDELDKLEAKWGEEQEALDSSTGYNFLSRFRYEKRVKNSLLMLNEHRVAIAQDLDCECLTVYACMLAHYDYGKHMVIVQTGNVAEETGFSKDTVKRCFVDLAYGRYIKEVDMLDVRNTTPRFFKVRKSERENLESQRYENYNPENTDSVEQVYNQRICALKARISETIEDCNKLIKHYERSLERWQKNFEEQWDRAIKAEREVENLKQENQDKDAEIERLKKKLESYGIEDQELKYDYDDLDDEIPF